VTTETADTAEFDERRPSSAWTLWAWLMVAVATVSIAAGVVGGILAPSVVLDVVSLWPLAVGAFFVAVALLPLRRRGPARISAVLPLLLLTMLGSSVVLHLSAWERLPSASADVIGPRAVGIDDAELALNLTGSLSIEAGEGDLYSVWIERSGGSTGVPEALESDFEDGPFFVALREIEGGRWFQTSGWELALDPGPTWSLTVDSPDLEANLTGMQLKSLSLGGAGFVAVPSPVAVDIAINIEGRYRVEVPAETSVRIIGAATVPGGWVETGDGHQSPYGGWSLVITVGEGAQLEVATSSS
jgi:hypothetical protein